MVNWKSFILVEQTLQDFVGCHLLVSVDYLYSFVAGHISQSSHFKNFIPEISSGKILTILVTVLLVSFKQPSNNKIWLLYQCFLPAFFTSQWYEWQLQTLKNNGSCKIMTSSSYQWKIYDYFVKLEPFGEVCGGCPLQLCCRTSFAKLKNTKNKLLG